MHIQNKFLRLIVSVFLPIIIYTSLALVMVEGDLDETLEYMILFAIYGFLIVIPTLFFIACISYYLLTEKKDRSKVSFMVLIGLLILLIIIVVLYLTPFITDLLDSLF